MKKMILAASLVCIAGLAHAVESPKWDMVQLGYLSVDLDDDISFDGFGIAGSKLLGENVFIMGAYGRLSEDVDVVGDSVDLDYTPLSVGLGVRHPVAPNIDIFGVVSYEDVELKASYSGDSDSVSDNGYGFSAGVRAMVIPSLELSGSLNYINMEESETGFGVSAHYYFTDQFSLGAGYSKSDDVDGTSLVASFYF